MKIGRVGLFVLVFPMMAHSALEMKGISFLQEGEVSKVIFEFSEKGIKASKFKSEKDKQIIVDLQDTKALPQVMRAFDTSEFEGAVVFVSPYKKPDHPNDIRVAIQLRDNVGSALEVIDNKLILYIENRFGVLSQGESHKKIGNILEGKKFYSSKIHTPKSDSIEDILENITQSGAKKYVGKRIHFNVKDVAVRELLKMIAGASGFNIIIDKSVESVSPLTLSLDNIPWDQALDTILELSKLLATKNGSILVVKTIGQAHKEKQQEIAAEKLLEVAKPLVTKLFPISYAKSSELIKILSEYTTKGKGKISVDTRTNQLIIKDTVEVIERIEKMMEVLDTQTPQVLIEAKLVEAIEGFSRKIGFESGVGFDYNLHGPTSGLDSEDSGEFSFSTIGQGGDGQSTFLGISVDVFRRLIGLNMTLQLLEKENKGRVISSPKVITQNKKSASIVSTTSISFLRTVFDKEGNPVGSGFATLSAPLSLSVTPQVTNEGSIIMEIAIEKSSFSRTEESRRGSAPPDLTSNNITTNVLVDNGSTVVIGGIYSFIESASHSGIPWLKDIPLLGWLFRTAHNPDKNKQELIIFITPRIINKEKTSLSEKNPLG